MSSPDGLKHDILGLSNTRTLVYIVLRSIHMGVNSTQTTSIRANITFSGQMCCNITQLSRAVANASRSAKTDVPFQSMRTVRIVLGLLLQEGGECNC